MFVLLFLPSSCAKTANRIQKWPKYVCCFSLGRKKPCIFKGVSFVVCVLCSEFFLLHLLADTVCLDKRSVASSS